MGEGVYVVHEIDLSRVVMFGMNPYKWHEVWNQRNLHSYKEIRSLAYPVRARTCEKGANFRQVG